MIDGQEIYLGEVKTGLSWFEADAKSVEVGGYLMEITSPSESSLLRRLEKCILYILIREDSLKH